MRRFVNLFGKFSPLCGAAVEKRRRRARSMKIGKPERVPLAERERTDRLLLRQN